jgi:hypothetical protein
MKKPAHVGYDARRYMQKRGKETFAGAIQQKSSAAGAEKAITQMEKVEPGSATWGTLRVPKDQVTATQRKRSTRPPDASASA